MDEYTRDQFEAALAALGLDPATTTSVFLDSTWVRVEHTDRPATSIPLTTPDEA